MWEMVEQLVVVQTRYYYERMQPPRADWYSLSRIEQGPISVPYQRLPIERFCLQSLQTFNHLLCATCNRDSVSLIFCDEGRQYVCALPQNGMEPVLQVLAMGDAAEIQELLPRANRVVFDDPSKLHESDLACSVFSLMFDYIRTPSGNLFLVDISPVPCACHFMPLFFNSASLRDWVREWKHDKVSLARASSRMVVRGKHKECTIMAFMSKPMQIKVIRCEAEAEAYE